MKRSNLIFLYAASFVIGTGIFIGLFHTGLFGSMDVFFYRGIAILLVTGAAIGAVLLVVRKRIPGLITLKDIYIVILTLVSVNILFFTHVPVTAERSVSIFLLGYMNKNADKIVTKEDLTQAFLREYIVVDDNIEKRIHEQQASGNITPQARGYRLTKQGQVLMKFYVFIADLFGIDKRIVAPN